MQALIFSIIFLGAAVLFLRNALAIRKQILSGKPVDVSGNATERLKNMLLVAFGQQKMVFKPVAGLLHILVYAGFVIINIEMLEIIADGISGSHRLFSGMGSLYNTLIAAFEVLAFLVLVSCLLFLIRRNILRIPRFLKPELNNWPRTDANLILVTEILLMSAFLFMNAADSLLQQAAHPHYHTAGCFPVSAMLTPLLSGFSASSLVFIERFCWWFHIVGVLAFLNYLPYSKHLHILLAFPATYVANLRPKGEFTNMESVTREVKLMLDPSADPYAQPASDAAPEKFGAKDVTDLTRIQLLHAFTCTECGRCTEACPANTTGKKLSPRKILMDTRDRLQDLHAFRAKNGKEAHDGKFLLGDYISEEEVLACNTCNACTQACPVNLDPLSVIIDLRRNMIMEESKAPAEWTGMLTNIENNGAPWQFAQADRMNWVNES